MSEPRSQRQRIRRWLFVLLAGVGVVAVLIALAYAVYAVIVFGWDWTGFFGGLSKKTVKSATEDKEYLAAKTLWDWMQLLLVPVMLAVGGFWLNQLQKSRDERTAAQRDTTEREIAADNQREAALQAYIDKIGELLLREHEHLGVSPGNSQVENIARARTVTVLRILDPDRRVSLLRFLSQAGILQLCTESDLANIDLSKTNLVRFNLSKFKLRKANLRGAYLREANLREANLRKADLSWANLSGADLSGADLNGADLRGARGLRDELRANCKSRGALVDPIPSTTSSHLSVSFPVSSIPQSDGGQVQSLPLALAAETPPAAGGTTPSKQEEDSADANNNDVPPQPDSPS